MTLLASAVDADPSVRGPRVRLASELALLGLLYLGYAAATAAIDVRAEDAHERGHHILRLETLVHLDIEQPLNAFVVAVPALGLLFVYLYATLHYVVTPVVMLWIAVRRATATALPATGCSQPPSWASSATGCFPPRPRGCSTPASST